MNAVRALTTADRRALDESATIRALVASVTDAVELAPRAEAEIRQAAAEQIRLVLDRLEAAAVAGATLHYDELAADRHVQSGCWACSHWHKALGACSVLRAMRRRIDRQHSQFRRAMRRLGRG